MNLTRSVSSLLTLLALSFPGSVLADAPIRPPVKKTAPKEAPKLEKAERERIRKSQRAIKNDVARMRGALKAVAPDSGPVPAQVSISTLKRVEANAKRIQALALKVKAKAKADVYASVAAHARSARQVLSRIRAAKRPRAADVRTLRATLEKAAKLNRHGLSIEPVILQ